jgi:hypothetical protein
MRRPPSRRPPCRRKSSSRACSMVMSAAKSCCWSSGADSAVSIPLILASRSLWTRIASMLPKRRGAPRGSRRVHRTHCPGLRAQARIPEVATRGRSGSRRLRRPPESRRARSRAVGARTRAAVLRRAGPLSRFAIEYEELDGRRRHEDVEVLTVHYRGAHGAAAARSGFTAYRGFSARVGGRGGGGRSGGRSGGLAEEVLR